MLYICYHTYVILSRFNLCFVYKYNLIFIKISIHICRISIIVFNFLYIFSRKIINMDE